MELKNTLNNELNTLTRLNSKNCVQLEVLLKYFQKLSEKKLNLSNNETALLLPKLFHKLSQTAAAANANKLMFRNTIESLNNAINILDENSVNLYNDIKKKYSQKFVLNANFINSFIYSSENIIKQILEEQNSNKEAIKAEFKAKRKEKFKQYKLEENKTLLISEKENNVFLPYTLAEVYELSKNNSSSVEDIIRNNFIISLDNFRSPSTSRFRETYNLSRKKENRTILASLKLASKFMFINQLNPAIIVACRSVEQLIEYLTHLTDNTVDKFPHFEIKYEYNPMKI